MDLTALWKESSMAILEETAQLVKEKLGPDFDAVTIEKIVIENKALGNSPGSI